MAPHHGRSTEPDAYNKGTAAPRASGCTVALCQTRNQSRDLGEEGPG